MRGGLTGAIDAICRALLQEFPGLDPARLRGAVERGTAKAATASLDTEGHRIVSQQLARVEATEESAERAAILRQLAADLEGRGDAERALVVRLSAFAEQQDVADLDPLLRLGKLTERWSELPLDAMTVLIEIDDPASVARLRDIANAWRELGSAYRAADAYERVLLLAPDDEVAHEGLEVFYRSTGEWPVLVDLLRRRAELASLAGVDRAELVREIAQIYERELGDDAGAREAYREADRLAPDHPEVLDALARLAVRLGGLDDEALTALERSSTITSEPRARARVLHRAAEIARQTDWDKAQDLFQRALAADPELVAAIDGLALLLRDRGELGGCVDVLVAALARPALAAEHSRWAADAADFCVALGDTERAKDLYRVARVADPTNHHAGLALVELCWDTGAVVELAPILEELCRTTTEPARLRGYLLQLAKVARELGDAPAVRAALTRAVAIDARDPGPTRELAEILFEAQDFAAARPLLDLLLDDHEASFGDDLRVELHFRAARCAKELGDTAAATKQTAITLALAPSYRPALVLRSELGDADPFTRAADQLALANIAPPEERAALFAALGDTYARLEDPATAREMYREALLYQPTDRMLLTKSLGLVADEGDWSYSLDLVTRLAESEADPVVRGRYRYLAATIARDNLDDPERALPLFDRAIEDDPKLFVAADALEASLETVGDLDALAGFYYRRLGHVRDDEGRAGERLRLWSCLGLLCERVGRLDDAIVAAEVARSLDPESTARREHLAGLYAHADPKHDPAAITIHHALLAHDHRRVASYVALRAAYKRLGQLEQARACDEALAIVGAGAANAARIDELFGDDLATATADPASRRPLTNEDWAALAKLDVDPQLSALFAIVAPPFAAERVRLKPPRALAGKDVRDRELPGPVARVLGQVLGAFGLARPPVYVDRDQLVASMIALRARDGVLAPVLVIGKPALDAQHTDRELAFLFARQLADLRSDRIARLLCPRPGDLAQVVELVLSPGQGAARGWLAAALHPVELDKALAIGERLRDQGIDSMRAARQWRAATEHAADRIGLVVAGDLATCVRMLEGTGTNATSDIHRVLDLVWASVTEDVLAVRARVEGWRRR